MTDQTQTTTEPVSEIDHAIAVIASFSSYGYGRHNVGAALDVIKAAFTTPQPLAIGLDREAVATIRAALDSKAGIVDLRDFSEELTTILALAAPAEGKGVQLTAIPAADVPMWSDGIVTDGQRVAFAQKSEADYGGFYWACDGGDGCLEWEPTWFIDPACLPAAPTGGRS